MRRLSIAWRFGYGQRCAIASPVSAKSITGFQRSHNAIGQRAACIHECLHGVRDNRFVPQDVALNRIEDSRSGNLSLTIHCDGERAAAGKSSGVASQVDDSVLTLFEAPVFSQQTDYLPRIRPLPKFLVNQLLIFAGAI